MLGLRSLLPGEALDEDNDSKKKTRKRLPAKQALAAELEPKKTKSTEVATATDPDEGPWCPIHNSPAHALKDYIRVKSLVQTRTHGDCFICLKPGHHAKACPERTQWGHLPGRGDGSCSHSITRVMEVRKEGPSRRPVQQHEAEIFPAGGLVPASSRVQATPQRRRV